jgi:Flp pilus assembly protein TadG
MSRRRTLFRRLARDRHGLSAVEFALLAPIILIMYFMFAELIQGFMAQKRMGHVASMVADLISQTDAVSAEEVDGVFDIGELIMKPFPTTTLKQRVSSVTRDDRGVARVDWSKGKGMTALAEKSAVTNPAVPTDLIANGESVIMAEVTYEYRSPIGRLAPPLANVMNERTTFSSRYYLRPRNTEKVGYED